MEGSGENFFKYANSNASKDDHEESGTHDITKETNRALIIDPKGFPDSSVGRESASNAGDPHSIPGFGRYPGESKGYSLQYSSLENSVDCIVHWVAKSQARLNDFHLTDPKVMEIYELSNK